VARQVTLAVGTLVSKALVGWLNTLVIVDDDRYKEWLRLIRERPPTVPLITVANHESYVLIPTPPTVCMPAASAPYLKPWRYADAATTRL